MALSDRYKLSNQRDDLDKSILYLTESLLLSPLSWLAHGPMIVEVLYHLALSLLTRSRLSKEPEDSIHAATYFRHLQNPAQAPLVFLRPSVTASLVETLALQIELKAAGGIVERTLEEMAVLTHGLLTSNPSSDNTTSASTCFGKAVSSELTELSVFQGQLMNQIIECLRLTRTHKPELLWIHMTLIRCLYARHDIIVNDDLGEAVSILDELIASSSPGGGSLGDEFLAMLQEHLPNIAMFRSMVGSNPEHSEEAIYRARAFLASSSVEEPLHSTWSQVLDHGAKDRFKNFGPIGGLGASSNDSQHSPPVPPEGPDISWETGPFHGLLDGIHSNHTTEIDEAIELGRAILTSSGPNDLYALQDFGAILFEAFQRTHKIEYLTESINTHRQLLARPLPRILRLLVIARISLSLLTRSLITPGQTLGYRADDVRETLELFPQFLNDGGGWLSPLDRFHGACAWASFTRVTEQPTVSTAYEGALSLMQDSLFFAPTLQLQHATLATHDPTRSMPLDYASYQVGRGQLENAIETLERGRAILWSEMRQFRIPIDQLLKAAPELGDKFAAVNRDLEELTKSIPPSHELSTDDAVADSDNLRAGDQFGGLLLKQRGLLKERDELISQIRALPDFDRFLTSPSFDTLRSAASSGPVIIINHSSWRSDILVVFHNTSPSLIPTPDDFYDRASALKDKLLDSRVQDGLDSSQYVETLAFVLAELYKLVGKPVIERFRELQVQNYSRIWWCPTSVFCFLPLHAMGPIPSDDGKMQYFLDLYTCSYTPSLSALIRSHSRDSGSRSSGRPSLLLVAQTDLSLPNVGDEIQVVRALDTEVTSLISEAATPSAVMDGFQQHQFVHFACHGTLEAGKPFEAGFELYGHERLTLLEIVRSDLPTAEFAFLSACHTAELTEGSITDEGLHLAAAVQYSGFRSVVGTMWAMVDEDGRDLAKDFYKALFSKSKREREMPYHERSAKALRFAVRKLRRKRYITLERWVNFVHFGA
jgi:CHAT domain-containing protein